MRVEVSCDKIRFQSSKIGKLMKYKQLTMKERYQIEALIKEGLSQRAIALNICVHHSTVSRELKRNSLDNNEYYAVNATLSARLRY